MANSSGRPSSLRAPGDGLSWPDSDRRGSPLKDTGERRRRKDFEEIAADLVEAQSEIRGQKEDIANLHVLVTGLLTSLGGIDGKVDILTELCRGIDGKADKATSFKNAIQFAAVLIVPVLVALIGAYALLKSQAPQALPK